MMSLTMMDMTLVSLVCALLPLLFCVLMILLVELVAWDMSFSYQQELSPNVAFLRLSCSYQKE